jgi:hypothetical protein
VIRPIRGIDGSTSMWAVPPVRGQMNSARMHVSVQIFWQTAFEDVISLHIVHSSEAIALTPELLS